MTNPAQNEVRRRLEELSASWKLPDAAPEQLLRLLDLVAAERTAITAVREPSRAVELHVADSLAGLGVSELASAKRVADLGSGGGFPGLALAVALPLTTVTLVESVGKKCEFLRRAADEVGLMNVEVVSKRAEDWVEGLESQDAVTARALAPLGVLIEYAAPLLREGGCLVAWKGVRDSAEEAQGETAAAIVGLRPAAIIPSVDVKGADSRSLHLYLKVGATPSRFPRRAGMARKRPLQA